MLLTSSSRRLWRKTYARSKLWIWRLIGIHFPWMACLNLATFDLLSQLQESAVTEQGKAPRTVWLCRDSPSISHLQAGCRLSFAAIRWMALAVLSLSSSANQLEKYVVFPVCFQNREIDHFIENWLYFPPSLPLPCFITLEPLLVLWSWLDYGPPINFGDRCMHGWAL